MGVQTNDKIEIGNIYKHSHRQGNFIVISNSNNLICVCSISNGECFIDTEKDFRFYYTRLNPIKTWKDTPEMGKFYGARYCGGTRYGYDWITGQFVSPQGHNICRGGETTAQYFSGDGKMEGATNNYEIIEFNSMFELIIWLKDR